MNNSVKNSLDLIAKNINKDWSINAKIRYVYIEVGKIISKDNKFFYTLINIMKNSHYNKEEMIKKQEIDYSLIENEFEVICNSAAGILKYTFDKIGIKNEIIKIIKTDKFEINNSDYKYNIDLKHYFNSVIGDDNKTYFLRIIPDLMNIQYGLETEHFAQKLIKVKENGEILNAYEGKQIDNSVLSGEDVKKLDIEIGYLKKLNNGNYSNYNDDLIKIIDEEYKKLHMQLLCDETVFLKKALKYFNENNILIDLRETSIFDLNHNQLDYWTKHLENIIRSEYQEKDNFNSLNLIEKIKDQTGLIDKNLPQKDKTIIVKRIYRLIGKIAETYIDQEYLYNPKDKNKICSTKYLSHKFELMFPYIFGCNSEKEDLITSKFKGIAEINAYVDMMLEKIFPEVSKSNSKDISNLTINEKNSIVKTRIHKATIINKKTNEYSIIFLIDNQGSPYIFNPNNGNFKKLSKTDELEISIHYTIISNSIKKIIFESDKTDSVKNR